MTGRPAKRLRPTAGSAAKNRPSREPLTGRISRVESMRAGKAVAPADPGGDRLAQLVGAADLGIGAERRLASASLSMTNAGIDLAGSPTVISIGFWLTGRDAVEQAAARG